MSDITKPQYFCTRCQVHWSGTHRCRDRIDAQRAIEAENQSLRAQLLAARERIRFLQLSAGDHLSRHDEVEAAARAEALEAAARICDSRALSASDHAQANQGLGWTASGEATKCAMAIRARKGASDA